MKYLKIKTSLGYFYTVSNGRYGRFSSERMDGFIFCEPCATKINDQFNELELQSETVELNTIWSFGCQNVKHDEVNA